MKELPFQVKCIMACLCLLAQNGNSDAFDRTTHWTVLRQLGFWSQNLTLHAIIAQHIVHIKGNIIIFATEISKLERNCLKVGKKSNFV